MNRQITSITNPMKPLKAEVEYLGHGASAPYEVRLLNTRTGNYEPQVRYRKTEEEAVALAHSMVGMPAPELAYA